MVHARKDCAKHQAVKSSISCHLVPVALAPVCRLHLETPQAHKVPRSNAAPPGSSMQPSKASLSWIDLSSKWNMLLHTYRYEPGLAS
jgi:hypothetical protein